MKGLDQFNLNNVPNEGDTIHLTVTNPRGHRHSLVLPDFGVNTRALEPRGGEVTVEFIGPIRLECFSTSAAYRGGERAHPTVTLTTSAW